MAAATVMQFVEDAKQDINSPSTSVFPSKMAAYKNMVSNLDEVCRCGCFRNGNYP